MGIFFCALTVIRFTEKLKKGKFRFLRFLTRHKSEHEKITCGKRENERFRSSLQFDLGAQKFCNKFLKEKNLKSESFGKFTRKLLGKLLKNSMKLWKPLKPRNLESIKIYAFRKALSLL